jgi:AcrR family transcriptional regulator
MPYRPTEKTKAHKQETRTRILAAARDVVAAAGFGGAQMTAVAEAAYVSVGTLYAYFPSKADLFGAVFRRVAEREVAVLTDAAGRDGPPAERLERALRTLGGRAVQAGSLAFSLIAEPVDPIVEAERLKARESYAEVLADLLRDGMAAGVFRRHRPELAAACMVGALAEAIIVPRPSAPDETLIDEIVTFCLNGIRQEGALP